MKKLLFTLALLLPLMAGAMKIEKDEVDEFFGTRTMYTNFETIYSKNGETLAFRFRTQAGKEYLDLRWTDGRPHVVSERTPLMFKSTNGDIASFETKDIESSDGSVNRYGSSWTLYARYSGDLNYFENNIIKLIRIYTASGYIDFDISENNAKKLINLYNLFRATLNNEIGHAVYGDFTLTFVKKGKRASSWDVIKEQTLRDLSKDELQQIVDEWKAQSNDNYDYDVRIKKEK